MFARVLHALVLKLEGVPPMTGLPEIPPAVPAVPVAAAAAPPPPRALDLIRADADAARTAHVAAQNAVRASHDVLKTLAAEYRAALAFFEADCQAVERSLGALFEQLKAALR
ncbi:hypothetical protein GALL_207840 [mine drainage metagenome]|uniref:Uncharacterized protein n=1 Tax=mine drainage metagenome TaxID=410659 RepID=A0A1J5RMG7_9ZZZZ